MAAVEAEDLERITRALGEQPRRVVPAHGHGAPSNRRYVAQLRGRTVFAKVAGFDYTADWLRREHGVCGALAGRPFLPALIGWDDDGTHPVLVIDDLSQARWPPPWQSADVDAVLSALEQIHATPAPAHVVAEPSGRGRAAPLGSPAGTGTVRIAAGRLLPGPLRAPPDPAGAPRPGTPGGTGAGRAAMGRPRHRAPGAGWRLRRLRVAPGQFREATTPRDRPAYDAPRPATGHRRGGGTGRRGGPKHRWGQPRASSNLALGTTRDLPATTYDRSGR